MARKEVNDPLLGSVIGNYRVLQKLGSGAMGTVYLGEHLQIGKRVAIKILATHLAENTDMVERFMFEARAIGVLEHPNIIEMFDFDVLEDGRQYYTMEYLQGETLSDRMKRGPFALWELSGILEQVCDALHVVHEKGIIHRDLKPSNVFLARKGTRVLVKILDFGIAKIHDSMKKDGDLMTSTGAVMGTPLFMSPEQALGQSTGLTLRSDLYSLGVILFKILGECYPVKGTGIQEVMAFHFMHEAIELRQVNPRIPEPLARVVMQCLRKDPALRFESSSHLFAAYQDAVATLPADWVVPRPPQSEVLEETLLPDNMQDSAREQPGGAGTSNSFLNPIPSPSPFSTHPSLVPPPPPPPVPASAFQTEFSQPHPLMEASNPDLTSHSLLGGGSYSGVRRAGSPGKLVMIGVVITLLVGVGAYFVFFREPSDSRGAVAPAGPVPSDMTAVDPMTPAVRTIQVRVTSEPDDAEVLVRRGQGATVTKRTPFLMDFEESEDVTFIATRPGYLEEKKTLKMDRELVHLQLSPVAVEPPKPDSGTKIPPPVDMRPGTLPMKVMKHDPKTFGNDLL